MFGRRQLVAARATAPITTQAVAVSGAGHQYNPSLRLSLADGIAAGVFARVCSAPAEGEMGCHAIVRTDSGAGRSPQASKTTTPAGYGATQLQTVYGLSGAASTSGETVAIVDAYNDPDLANNLATYRSEYGLPACTTASGCLRIVSQTGSTTKLPSSNESWGEEESLDVDMVSANCPLCKIVMVEATSPTDANLAAAMNYAATISGVVAISNSYGSSESSSETASAEEAAYNHPGIAVVASNGDSGYGVSTPASYSTVIAAGGTTLDLTSSNTRSSETVWSDSGSGCSAYIAQPAWQTSLPVPTGCTKRVVGDVAYDADPNTGVAVYDTYVSGGGWLVFGGTSVSSPATAAIIARAGGAALGVTSGNGAYPASYIYAHHTGNLYDVTSGSDGSCSTAFLCTGEVGYDGPTGLGTPEGLGAY